MHDRGRARDRQTLRRPARTRRKRTPRGRRRRARRATCGRSSASATSPAGLAYAVNREYVGRETLLTDGDEVAIIPPVSGGAFVLSAEPLDVERVVAEAASDDAGAVATFIGTVRRQSRGREVVRLEYEAFEEMAEPMLRRLADELTAKHGLCEVAIHHRVGPVDIGEASVVIAVSAPHRAAALDACRDAIDTLKETIPLWKKEIYADGEEWIGRGS